MAHHLVETLWISGHLSSLQWWLVLASIIAALWGTKFCIFLHAMNVRIWFKNFQAKIHLNNVFICFWWHTAVGILSFDLFRRNLIVLLNFKVQLCPRVVNNDGRDLGISRGSQCGCCGHIRAKMHCFDSKWLDKAVSVNVFLNQIDKPLAHFAAVPGSTLFYQAVLDDNTSTVLIKNSVSLYNKFIQIYFRCVWSHQISDQKWLEFHVFLINADRCASHLDTKSDGSSVSWLTSDINATSKSIN